MIVSNPEVTLDVEAAGLPEVQAQAGFLDWMLVSVVDGDDGKQYQLGITPMSLKLEKVDLYMLRLSSVQGTVAQLPGSIYKVADFPEAPVGRCIYPGGTLTIKKSEHEVAVDCGDFHLTCKDDHTWHYTVEDKKEGIKAEVVHTGVGFPTWYGRPGEKPSVLTTHSITYGYFWTGTVEGTLAIKGKKVKVKGAGVRERYVAIDTSPAEIGGWEDWMWCHFDEVSASMYEFKYGNHKAMSLYLVEEKEYFPEVEFNIEHSEWAYFRQVGIFIPTHYKITAQTDAGVLEFETNVTGGMLAGSTGQAPDAPVAALNWDRLVGTFTYKDGRKRKLTNGLGNTAIRCWKPYPSIILPALLSEMPKLSAHPMSALE